MNVDKGRKPFRMHWGVGSTLVYVLFAGSTLGFVAFAISRPVELVGADYYARSLTHDERLAATRRADALGRALSVRRDDERRAIVVRLPRAHASSATGTMTLYRPSDMTQDRVINLAVDREGEQRVPLDGLARGHWRVELRWRVAGETYYREQTVDVR